MQREAALRKKQAAEANRIRKLEKEKQLAKEREEKKKLADAKKIHELQKDIKLAEAKKKKNDDIAEMNRQTALAKETKKSLGLKHAAAIVGGTVVGSGAIVGVLSEGIVDAATLLSHLTGALKILDKALALARQFSENDRNCRMVNKRGILFAAILNQCKDSIERDNQDALISEIHIKAVETLGIQFDKLYTLVKQYQEKHWALRTISIMSFKNKYNFIEKLVDNAVQDLQVGFDIQIIQQNKYILNKLDKVLKVQKAEKLKKSNRRKKSSILDANEIPVENIVFKNTKGHFINAGGQATVYKCIYDGEEAAAKIIDIGNIQPSKISKVYDNFKREVAIMCSLRHPRLVFVYGAVTTIPQQLILVMAYAPNGDLRDKLNHSSHSTFNWKFRCRILNDIAVGMAYLHDKSVEHRDLKSSNILLDHNGRALLTDFGLSQDANLTTHTQSIMGWQATQDGGAGTLPFMSPEFLDGEPYTFKCDVYSFGIIIYEVITFKEPWIGLNALQVMRAVDKGKRPSLLDEKGQSILPDNIKFCGILDLMKNCWQQDPNDRPAANDAKDTITQIAFSLINA
eukprot:g11398.t1